MLRQTQALGRTGPGLSGMVIARNPARAAVSNPARAMRRTFVPDPCRTGKDRRRMGNAGRGYVERALAIEAFSPYGSTCSR